MALPAEFHSLPMHWSLLLVIGWVLVARVSAGQSLSLPAEPPPGGYELRWVQHLQPVPEPPGGLIPCPDSTGRLWGYCDTLGRMWIKPCLSWQLSFFFGPFGQYENPQGKSETRHDDYFFFNARGEALRADRQTVIIRQPDGSLRLEPLQDWLWKPVFYRFVREKDTGRVLADSTYGPLTRRPYWNSAPIGGGRGRGIGFHRRARPRKHGRYPRDESQRGALLDERGRRLTPFAYWRIFAFTDGITMAQRTGYFPGGGFELINRQGRRLLPGGPYPSIEYRGYNRVFVYRYRGEIGESAMLDTTGRVIRTWHPFGLHWAIQGYVVRQNYQDIDVPFDKRRVHLLDTDGRVLLGGQRFRTVLSILDTAATRKRPYAPLAPQDFLKACAVQDTVGRWGVVGHDGRWLLPCSAERLVSRPGLPLDIQSSMSSPLLYLRVAGRWGVFDARERRVVVPFRYDSLATRLRNGWVGAIREGQPVVLYRGREVAQGWLEEPPNEDLEVNRYWARQVAYQTLRRADGASTLIDTTGRQLMPWLPQTRRLIVSAYLPDSLVWATLPRPGYSATSTDWSDYYITLLTRRGQRVVHQTFSLQYAGYGLLRSEEGQIYTVGGKWLGQERESYILARGWVLLREGSVLRDPEGKEHLPPPGWRWRRTMPEHTDNYEFAPFERHVMGVYNWSKETKKSRENYITRSGRKVYKSDRQY